MQKGLKLYQCILYSFSAKCIETAPVHFAYSFSAKGIETAPVRFIYSFSAKSIGTAPMHFLYSFNAKCIETAPVLLIYFALTLRAFHNALYMHLYRAPIYRCIYIYIYIGVYIYICIYAYIGIYIYMYRALVLNTRKASGLCLSVRTCIIMQRRLAEEESASVSGLPPFKHAEALCTCNNACVK